MRILTLEITSRCQNKCWFCSTDASESGIDMPTDRVISIINEYRGEYDILRLSGGEPTLHADIGKIIDIAGDYYFVVLLTNGYTYYEHPKISEYHISVHRNDKNCYETIYKHHKVGHSVVVTSILAPYNDVDAAIECACRLRIPVHLYKLQYIGRAKFLRKIDISVTGDDDISEKLLINFKGEVMINETNNDRTGVSCN